jgi:hypothetical protein
MLLAGVAWLTVPAVAQQVDSLRGAVAETAVSQDLLPQQPSADGTTDPAAVPQTDRDEAPPYQPTSSGALDPAEEASLDTSLPAPLPREDIFTDEIMVQPAAQRIRAQNAARAQLPDGVATPEDPTAARTAPLDDLSTGTVRFGRIDSLDEERNTRATTDNSRTGAIEGLDRAPDADPFAPVGIRTGTFVFTPTLEQGIGWTSNASTSPGGGGSVYSETGLRLEAISDWSRHSATIRADGRYRQSLSGEEISDFEGGGDASVRLDLGNEFAATGGIGYRIQPESASSPDSIENAVTEPLRQTLTGSAGLSKDVGKLRLGVTGEVVRDVYGDAELEGGGILSQRDRNTTLATVSLRGGYEISPALRPFVEAEVGRRLYDETVDSEGFARSADRMGLRGGVAFDFGEKLTGEIAAGWLTERPDDERLDAISGASVEGSLAWSPVRGTTVEATASTQVEGTTRAGETGSLLYAGSLAVSRNLRSDLTGRALVGLDWRDYAGSGDRDLIARGEVSLTWWLNRYAGVTGRVGHEIQRSTLPDRDYDATSIYLGMTLQR